MSFMDKYRVFLGVGEVNEGQMSGKVLFGFGKKGLFIQFPEVGKVLYLHQGNRIKRFTVKKKIIDKHVKGSSFAKFAAYSAALNKDQADVGRRIATSQRLAESGRDKFVKTKASVVEFYFGSDFYSLLLNESDYPDVRKDLNLAYNNPKSFFDKSLDDWEKFSTIKKGKLFWWIYWIIAILISASFSSTAKPDQASLFVFTLFLFSFYPLWQRIKLLLQGKSRVNDFRNSKEYNLAIKNFK